jgi:CTP:molybdopterin cytidylyltransferase MocA
MPPMLVVGIILAAGASSRMGRPKALLPIGDDTFVTRVCRTLLEAGVDDLVVVAGDDRAAVAEAVAGAGLPVRIVENLRREEGQLSSVLAGLAVADRPGVDAVLVHLVDAPLVRPDTVRAVATATRCCSPGACSTTSAAPTRRSVRRGSCTHTPKTSPTFRSTTRAPARTSIRRRISSG